MEKIAIISNGIGIVYKFRIELVKKLINSQKEVHIISAVEKTDKEFYELLKKERIKIHEVKMDRRGKSLFGELKVLFQYYKILKHIRPNKILTYTIKPNIYGGIVSQILKIKYIPTITGVGTAFQNKGILKKLVVFLNKLALRKADKVFFQNNNNLEIYLKNKIVFKEQYQLVNGSGVNLEKFKLELKEKQEPLKVLFIGRIMKEKGIEEYLEVANKLKKIYTNKVIFQVLGSYEELNYKDTIERLEREEIIEYLGTSNDVRKEISEVHCLVNPSWHEGMSNVLLEAGAMKRFLIASDIPGCREIVLNNRTGFTFEKKNVDDLEEKIEKFISLSKNEYKEYIEKSYNYIKNNFSREKVIEEYLKVIDK